MFLGPLDLDLDWAEPSLSLPSIYDMSLACDPAFSLAYEFEIIWSFRKWGFRICLMIIFLSSFSALSFCSSSNWFLLKTCWERSLFLMIWCLWSRSFFRRSSTSFNYCYLLFSWISRSCWACFRSFIIFWIFFVYISFLFLILSSCSWRSLIRFCIWRSSF